MRMIRAISMLLASLLCLAGVVRAEFRPWTDIKGNVIEAEYVRTTDNMVVLRKRDGAEIKVPVEALSQEDRTHAMLLSPPEIEIKVDDRLDRETLGYTGGKGFRQLRMESVTADVSIIKTSAEAYDAELSLELILIGWMEQMNRYVIIDRTASDFRFNEENKGLYRYVYGPVDHRNSTGSFRTGSEYEGFLAVVRDSRGEIIASKASRLEFERNADMILEAPKGGIFDENFTFIGISRPSRERAGGSGRS